MGFDYADWKGTVNTYFATIFMAGDIDTAKRVIRKHAMDEGMCVTIEPTTYIYTGGEEQGFKIGYINYPRFPIADYGVFRSKVIKMAHRVRLETGQMSFTVMFPDETEFYSCKDKDL